MLQDVLAPIIAIGIAELGDKTQLSILLLSFRTEKHLQLLFGVMLAFFIVDGMAVLVGWWATSMLPINLLKIFSGIIFIICGVWILIGYKVKTERRLYFKNAFLSGFVIIFITEWGDKTQIASGLFATKYNALLVLIGTLTALTLLSIIAIYSGKFILSRIDRRVITKIAGSLFILLGILSFLF